MNLMKARIFSFVFVFLFFFSSFPLTSLAAESEPELGPRELWDGIINVDFSYMPMWLTLLEFQQYTTSSNVTAGDVARAVYGSTGNALISIDGGEVDTYLNGFIRKRFTAQCTPSSQIGSFVLTLSADPVVFNNLYITIDYVSSDGNGNAVYDFYIYFNNYYVTSETMDIPINIASSTALTFPDANSVNALVGLNYNAPDDYAGSVWQYSKLEDVPSMDGYFAEQNEQMINQNTTIINQQEVQNNLTEQYNQFEYDKDAGITSESGEMKTEADSAIAEFEDAEHALSDTALDGLGQVDFDTSLNDIGGGSFFSAVNWVTSKMAILFGLTDFSSVFSIISVLVICSVLLGLRSLWASGTGSAPQYYDSGAPRLTKRG